MSPERIESLKELNRRLERALARLQRSDQELVRTGMVLDALSEVRWDVAYATGYLTSWISLLERANG